MIQDSKHSNTNSLRVKSIVILTLFLSLFSVIKAPVFSQVKKYTKIKKIKRKTFNLEKSAELRKKQKKDKSLYVVYSDRAENLVYLDPYAQKKGKNQKFLTPYYVLDEENDFLEIAIVDPTLLGKPKGLLSPLYSGKKTFKESKSAPYTGWIHRDNVIHYNHPIISEYNYKPMQYIVGIQDLNTLYKIEEHVKQDSVYVYKDPLFKEKSDKKLLLDQFVFLYKYDLKKKAALVSNLSNLKAEDSIARIMGWIPEALIKQIGQQHVFAINKKDSLAFYEKNKNKREYIDGKEIGSEVIYDLLKHREQTTKADDPTRVALPLSVWNHYDNKLINVDGEDVLIRKLEEIKEDNKIVNFHFVFDCKEDLKEKQLRIMSSLQRIWVLISTDEKYKEYKFSFSASSYGCGKFYAITKTKSFSSWMDYLQSIFSNPHIVYAPDININGIEQCFEYAINNMPEQSFTNNIIMVSGEERFFSPPNIEEITRKLGQTSSRIIFYQLENKTDDKHQDYMLQAKDILSRVSDSHSKFIRAFIVENELIKNPNTFTNIPAVDNIYVYDAPDHSTYQGGIAFPKINQQLTPTSFDKTLDSVLSKTIRFNAAFTGSLKYHEKELGFLRSKSGDKMKEIIIKDTAHAHKVELLPRNYMYEKYYKNKNYKQEDNFNTVSGYLFSKENLETTIDSYKSLIPLFSKNVDRKQRRVLNRMYRKNRKNINKELFRKTLRRRDYLAKLIFTKTGIPIKSEFLLNTKTKYLKRKRKISHGVLTENIKELRNKIEKLEEILSKKSTLIFKDGSKKSYYFISDNHIL